MARTTINIDDPILRDLKALQKTQAKPLRQLVSELLAIAIVGLRKNPKTTASFRWRTKSMNARVILEDKEAVRAVLDRYDSDYRKFEFLRPVNPLQE